MRRRGVRGVRAPLPLSPAQEQLLAQLRDGWILARPPRWDDFYLTHPHHPNSTVTVNVTTARSLIKHGYVVESGEKNGHTIYKVKE